MHTSPQTTFKQSTDDPAFKSFPDFNSAAPKSLSKSIENLSPNTENVKKIEPDYGAVKNISPTYEEIKDPQTSDADKPIILERSESFNLEAPVLDQIKMNLSMLDSAQSEVKPPIISQKNTSVGDLKLPASVYDSTYEDIKLPPKPKRAPPKPPSNLIHFTGHVPSIIMKSIAWIEKHALNEEGIYRESASVKKLLEMKNFFSMNDVIAPNEKDCHVVCGLLKNYFREREYLFTSKSKETFLDFLENDEDKIIRAEKLREMIRLNVNSQHLKTVHVLFTHLKRVADNSYINKMSAYNLGVCFSPTLFHEGPEMAPLIQVLIEDFDLIFQDEQ